jgi:hypothetical protein
MLHDVEVNVIHRCSDILAVLNWLGVVVNYTVVIMTTTSHATHTAIVYTQLSDL